MRQSIPLFLNPTLNLAAIKSSTRFTNQSVFFTPAWPEDAIMLLSWPWVVLSRSSLSRACLSYSYKHSIRNRNNPFSSVVCYCCSSVTKCFWMLIYTDSLPLVLARHSRFITVDLTSALQSQTHIQTPTIIAYSSPINAHQLGIISLPQSINITYPMGPKKKQEEIDLASLPECRSLNVTVLCRGKKTRASTILARLQKEAEKFMTKIKRNEVLDHAKQKNIYIDPNNLTDKQKKDPKFMQTVNTELTPTVVAKALQSLISTLNIKVRLQKKNNPVKEQDKNGRKYDMLYQLDNLLENKEQCEQLAKIGQNLRYVLVVDPKINWANAPELPEEAGNQQEEEDEEVKHYRELLKKEQKNEEDHEHEKTVDAKIQQIRTFRSQSHPTSQFRNCAISVLDSEIDPYNEEQSTKELVRQFFDNINRLNDELVEFEEWKRDKHAQKIPENNEQPIHRLRRGKTVMDLLNHIALSFDQPQQDQSIGTDTNDVLAAISQFSADRKGQYEPAGQDSNNQSGQTQFVAANQHLSITAALEEQIRQHLKYPGINRYQMPDLPSKSANLRQLHASEYSQFLKNGLQLPQFQRRNQLLNFEQYIKQFDEDRPYSFTDRTYEQHHDQPSLQRQLHHALQFSEYSSQAKYDENSDKLYLMLVYRNNGRRTHRKGWESNWKVIPNYESWAKYFRNNENNLLNQHYYDIDYEKVGNIEENTRVFSLQNGRTGAVVVEKDYTASNRNQSLLYALKNDFVFGVQRNSFFSENNGVRIYHQAEGGESAQYSSVVLLPSVRVRLSTSGNVLIEKEGSTRMITPNGYTIIYEGEKSTILHPTGGITYSNDTYINQMGYGLKDGRLFSAPTLKRTAGNGEVIKRDDNTVIVTKKGEQGSKWIKFYEGTEYKIENQGISIEKEGEPFVVCSGSQVKIATKGLNIELTQGIEGKYQFAIRFDDGNSLKVDRDLITIAQTGEKQEILVNITSNQISSHFEGEQLTVGSGKAELTRKGKTLDCRQDQDKYGEQDSLPKDYIEPRLFVISNDNSGVQLLSEKMVQAYLKQHAGEIFKTYEKPADKGKVQKHIVSKLSTTPEKYIINDLAINLDVFDNTQKQQPAASEQLISLRTLIRYPQLTPDDISELNRIKSASEQWKKQNLREQNQYGLKPKDDPSTKSKIQQKLLTIKTRQQHTPKTNPSALTQTAKQFYHSSADQLRKRKEKQDNELILRRQYMKKRDSIVQEYKHVSPNRKQPREEDFDNQNGQNAFDHYFQTQEGKKALAEMPEWVFRPKEVKPPLELDADIQNELNNSLQNRQDEESEDRKQRYDTVEVNLNPKADKQIFIKPSVFTQRDIDDERFAFQIQKKAYKYHEAKRRDYNVYGQQRKLKPEVRVLERTQPISEINQKYLVTEAPLDKKVKISSMSNKLTSSASNMVEMRKEGPHTLLMKTLDKGNDINRLLERRTMMVQADLNDKLQRDILINPIEANFGTILEKHTYELKIDVKNEDVISQRLTLKRPKSLHLKVQLSEMGPIAMGMTRKIIVTIKASSELVGKFNDQFELVTKHEIYHIPITAQIVAENQTRSISLQLSKGVNEIEENTKRKENSFELPRLK